MTVNYNLSPREYHSYPGAALSYSTAKRVVSESPMHGYLYHPQLGGKGREFKRHMNRGSLLHALLLGGADLVEISAVKKDGSPCEDYKSPAARAARDEILDAGKIPIFAHERAELESVAKQIRTRLMARGIDTSVGHCESSFLWSDNGVNLAARLDHFADGDDGVVVTDLKCTESANPDRLGYRIFDLGYDIQAASNIEAVESEWPGLAGRVQFNLAFCEVEPPYLISVVPMSGEWLDIGRSRWERAKRIWRECIGSGKWSGYPTVCIEPPVKALSVLLGEDE